VRRKGVTNRIRILLTSESGFMREGIRRLLEGYEDIEVIGEATDGKKSMEKMRNLEPDVVLMDMTMKAMNGFEVTRRLSRESPKTKVVILADRVTKDSVARTFMVGAHGCVPNTASAAEVGSAIRAVHSGEMYLHPSLTKTLIQACLSLRKIEAVTDPYEQLTDREKHVLRLAAEGRTARQIAQDLDIAVKTASGHLANLMKKLDIHSRAELIKYAIRRGIIQLEA